MEFKITVHLQSPEIVALLQDVVLGLRQQNQRMTAMSAELDDLTAQVQANTSLLQSATDLINGIADRIAAAGTDPAKLSALTAELRSDDDALAAAVAANTPAAKTA